MATALADFAVARGVRRAFGINGGAIAPFVAHAHARGVRVVHTRHESGAAFMAAEDSLASGAPSLVFTTTGPGLTNALTGLVAAAWEGAKIVAVAGATRAEHLGRGAFQEADPTLPEGLCAFAPGMRAFPVRNAADLPNVLDRLAVGLRRPGGFVATVSLAGDAALQTAARSTTCLPAAAPATPAGEVDRVAALIRGRDVVLWVGFGARSLAPQIATLAERCGARVMASPRAKGVFPERHPRYLGVTGFGGHGHVLDALRQRPPEHVVVLGSRLSEFTSGFDNGYLPGGRLVHVDLDPSVFGRAFPDVDTMGVQADLRTFVEAVADALPPRDDSPPARPLSIASPDDGAIGIHPARLMADVQRAVVEGSNALVFTEAGNAFSWGSHALHFDSPRYRTSTRFGAMGHASAGVVGAALARGKSVALVGDGAALMTNEISTAVAYGAPAVWIVLNDGAYGMVHHGMVAIDLEPVATAIPRVDFVAFARSQGAEGVRVRRSEQLPSALALALAQDSPFVIDVEIDPTVPPPFGNRNERLS